MVKETWRFKSFGHMRGASIVHVRRWTMESVRTTTSNSFFKALAICIADKLDGSNAELASEADTLPQTGYMVQVLEDGTVTVSLGA